LVRWSWRGVDHAWPVHCSVCGAKLELHRDASRGLLLIPSIADLLLCTVALASMRRNRDERVLLAYDAQEKSLECCSNAMTKNNRRRLAKKQFPPIPL
jgi:hypothetical protein